MQNSPARCYFSLIDSDILEVRQAALTSMLELCQFNVIYCEDANDKIFFQQIYLLAEKTLRFNLEEDIEKLKDFLKEVKLKH